MLILGHAGITLGTAVLFNTALIKSGLLPVAENKPGEQQHDSLPASPGKVPLPLKRLSWFTALASRIDIRILLVGSLLPDIIDKPIGQLWLRGVLDNGRIFCHTLLFLIIITLIGLYIFRTRHKNWLLVLSGGVFIHLILDRMWLVPVTLLWPVYGFAFPRLEDFTCWLNFILYGLFNNPAVYIPEIIGAVILVWFTASLVQRRKVRSFITNGQI